jgi:2-C-methyl-D-erythritol 2,4-cyclodiphosphate synthase
MSDYRVGIGYDLHRLAAGRRLVLGGVDVVYEYGLLGHSDGDVLLHAVTDALLGACGLPDIGELFPDTDAAYRDADSAGLLAEVVRRVRGAGFVPCNVDCVIHAEQPKLTSHKRPMAERIAALVGLPAECVSVKAKTHEGMGSIGAGEAIAATVVVLVMKS